MPSGRMSARRIMLQWWKQSHDMRVRPATFSVGTWVWLYSPRRYVGRSSKWQRNYSGPCLVTKVLGLVDVVVQRMACSKRQVIHIYKLKPFHGKASKSRLVDGTKPSPSEEESPSQSESNQESSRAPCCNLLIQMGTNGLWCLSSSRTRNTRTPRGR